MSHATKTARRDSYHHGDLRNALTDAAVELARSGTPVVLREAARRVGVSATAAYRHFTNHLELLDAVKKRALDELSTYIVQALANVPNDGEPADVAVARLRAVGEGYLAFARHQHGLFTAAYYRVPTPVVPVSGVAPFASTDSYRMLGAICDELVAVGRMTPSRRPFAEVAAWSTLHGLAVLQLDGPLRFLSQAERADATARTLDAMVRGLIG